jgi:hypothetical protein
VGLTLFLFRAFVFSDQMLFGSDTLGLGYVARDFYADALRTLGTIPRWAPLILGGTPFLEALSGGDSLYPPSLALLLVMDTYRALGWKLVLHVAAAGFFMFGWVRSLEASRPAALIAALAYMLGPFFVTLVYPGHDGKMFVIALAPLLFQAVERHFVRASVRTFVAVALVVGLVLLTTHFQMAYFLFGAVGVYAFFRAVQLWREARQAAAAGDGRDAGAAELEKAGGTAAEALATQETTSEQGGHPAAPRARRGGGAARTGGLRFALFLAAAVAGLGVAAVQFVPAAVYVTEASRRVQTTREAAGETGVAWSSSWSMHPEEAMGLLVPEFSGASVSSGPPTWAQNTYWGRNVFKLSSEYVGLVVLMLAAVSFVGAARAPHRWFFTGLGLVALFFSLGVHTPVWRIFYELVPGVRLFRAPAQVMFLFGFSVATLAALGVDRLLRAAAEADEECWRLVERVLWGGAGLLAILLLLAGSGGLTSLWTSVVYPDIPEQRMQALQVLTPHLVRGAAVALFVAIGVAALVHGSRRRWVKPAGLIAGLVVLVVVDEARIDAPFVQVIDFDQWSAPNAHVQAILQREAESDEPYRLLSLIQSGQDVEPALHGIELAGGHHPNDMNRYRELIGMVGSGIPVNILRAPAIRRMLNVRYIIWPDYDPTFGPAPEGPVLSRLQFANGQVHSTLLADNGLARARLVGSAVVKSDDEAVPYMMSGAFDPEREVVLAGPVPAPLAGGQVEGSVQWLQRTPNVQRLAVTTDAPALLVIADNWFPAWHATVDGQEAPVLRAYHTLRAVPVPEGSSTVELTYRSSLLRLSFWLSVVTLTALLSAAGAATWNARRKGGAT